MVDFTLPTPGVTSDWGDDLNTALDQIKTDLNDRLSDTQLSATLAAPVTPETFGAVGDGVTDDTAAFAAMCATSPQYVKLAAKSYVVDADVIDLPEGSLIEGIASGNYNLGVDSAAIRTTLLIGKITGYDPTDDADMDHTDPPSAPTHFGVKVGAGSIVRNIRVIPQGTSGTNYYDANYPGMNRATTVGSSTPTENASVGVWTEESCLVEGVYSASFYWGISVYTVCKVRDCYVRESDIGIMARGSDGAVTTSDALFCNTAGVKAEGNYWRFIGNRFEWNARYGLWSGGEGSYVGNLFDRNGWAGLYLASGKWGHSIAGNYFSRNGAGGDGTEGRWGWVNSTSHAGYVTTTPDNSCHIKIDYQRAITVTGNRYRAGQDDGGNGAAAPLYIYSSSQSPGATLASTVEIFGNAGVRGSSLGYATGASYAETPAIAGGTDTTLSAHLNDYPFSPSAGVRTTADVTADGQITGRGLSRPSSSQRASSSSATIAIPWPQGKAGTIYVDGSGSGTQRYAVVHIAFRTGSATYSTVVEDKIASGVISSAVWAGDVLTITLGTSAWWSYNYIGA